MVKYQKFSNYYDHDYQQNFIFLFMSLLTAPIVKNSPILAGIYFIFLEQHPRLNLRVFPYQDWKSRYQVRQYVPLSCNLCALILG